MKELNFFTLRYQLGSPWYQSQFSGAVLNQVTGEGTPGYLYVEPAALRILETLGPNVKLIASLRNPVDRAYSAFWHLVGGGELPIDAQFENEFEKDSHQIRTRGLYDAQVQRYLDLFNQKQLFFAVLELDLGVRAPETLQNAYEFLGVDPAFIPGTASKRANVGGSARRGGASIARLGAAVSRASDRIPAPVERLMRSTYGEVFKRLPESRPYESLDAGLRRAYLDYYRADIERLSETIGRDLTVWG